MSASDLNFILTITESVEQVVAYMKKTCPNFALYEAIGHNNKEYQYQIPTCDWESLTGIPLSTVEYWIREYDGGKFKDGWIFIDKYFDADYRECDDPATYVYICQLHTDFPEIRKILGYTHPIETWEPADFGVVARTKFLKYGHFDELMNFMQQLSTYNNARFPFSIHYNDDEGFVVPYASWYEWCGIDGFAEINEKLNGPNRMRESMDARLITYDAESGNIYMQSS
jgi:hypothetical protein